MAFDRTQLLALIDAYAAARADRDEAYREFAAWAFDDAHGQMLTARAAVADALGIAEPPALSDPITDAAMRRETRRAGAL